MDRRWFLKAVGAVVGGIALEQAIPFNRVWSFPSKIVVERWPETIDLNYVYFSAEDGPHRVIVMHSGEIIRERLGYPAIPFVRILYPTIPMLRIHSSE